MGGVKSRCALLPHPRKSNAHKPVPHKIFYPAPHAGQVDARREFIPKKDVYKKMKKIFPIILSLLVCMSADAATRKKKQPDVPVSAVVDYVLDGDTFSADVMLADGITIAVRVRIIDIDAPELSGACDQEIQMANLAKNRLAELLPAGAVVTLSRVKDDRYLGRIDASVKTEDGADISKILISEKLVRKYDGGKRKGWCL